MNWLYFALMTVLSWGVYGVFLHTGAVGMADPLNGRIKAFLIVGVAYFLVAILGPVLILLNNGSHWSFPVKGTVWSLLAGIVGALGALFVLLAFGAKGTHPAAVMSIVFAGAPIVNAFVAMTLKPPQGGMKWQFLLGIALAAIGGCLVAYYKPEAPPAKKGPPASAAKGTDSPDQPVKESPPKYRVT